MARLILFENPLDASRRRRVELPAGVSLFEWLDENAPTPDGCTRNVWVNGRVIAEGVPYRLRQADAVIVSLRPGIPAAIVPYIIQAIVSLAVSFIVSKIFAPSKPKAGNMPAPSQVYGLSPPKNTARLGEPIPVVYGSVIVTPDYAAQPYSEYQGNEQYLRAILCLGQGDMEVHTMIVGDTDAVMLPADVVAYSIFPPALHASTFGVIQGTTGIRENVVTSGDVADQELLAPNQASNNVPSTWYWKAVGAYVLYPPEGTEPEDFELPEGVLDFRTVTSPAARLAMLPPDPDLGTEAEACTAIFFNPEGAGGEGGGGERPTPFGLPAGYGYYITQYVATAYPETYIPPNSLVPPPGASTIGSVKWVGPFESCKQGQAGVRIDLDFSFPNGLYDVTSGGDISSHGTTVEVGVTPIDDTNAATGAEVIHEISWVEITNTALRFTETIGVALGRYRVRVHKSSDADDRPATQERVYWTGLKFELTATTPTVGTIYGNVTLAAVVLRASNAITGDAASSIRFRVTRKLPPPEGGTAAATVNPADAFADIVTARYGGNRPRNGDELDLEALAAARIRWAGHNGFNAVFDQPSTVWEALTLALQTVSAAPLPVGSRLSLMQDGVQPDRTQMFSDANIVAGSLTIGHSFDRDGTPVGQRVEYRDPRTFSAAAFLSPVGAPDYETISLFGCTDVAVAEEHAILAQNRRLLQRTTIGFTTELEGLTCLPGDRIGVQARMPRWAQGARVVAVDGFILKLDRPLEWTVGEVHAVQLRDPMGVPHVVSPVTRGADFYELVLPTPPPFPIVVHGDSMEATQISFGVDGQEITDWTIAAMKPDGNTVAIEAVNYNPAVWEGAAAHLLAVATTRPEVLL